MPWLQTSSCSHTIRPITLRLKTYPEYPNPTRDRPGWERRWYHRTWRYDDNDMSFYRNKDMAGCTDNHIWLSEQPYGRLWVYDSVHIPDLVFLLSVFQMSQKPLWQVTIRDDRLNSHVPDFLFTRFHNGSCHPFFLCGCRFFPRGIMVCYRMGKAISITTMNYSVAIFVYSRMIRYPDNAITELRYSRISK